MLIEALDVLLPHSEEICSPLNREDGAGRTVYEFNQASTNPKCRTANVLVGSDASAGLGQGFARFFSMFELAEVARMISKRFYPRVRKNRAQASRKLARDSVSKSEHQEEDPRKVGQGSSLSGGVLELQRALGNRAVARLFRRGTVPAIQRADEEAGASKSALVSAVGHAAEQGAKGKKLGTSGLLLEYEKTGKLSIITLEAVVFSQPRFISKVVGRLSRGEAVTVLGLKAGWCRVKTDDGQLGWTHSTNFIPQSLPELSSAPGRGPVPEQQEIEVAGRG